LKEGGLDTWLDEGGASPRSRVGGARREADLDALDAAAGGEPDPIRVVIVSDIRLYRESLSTLLGQFGHIAVVGVAGNAAEGIQLAAELQPDVVLLDIGVAGNAAAAHALREPAPHARTVVLATPQLEEDVIALAEAGVLGYVTRDESLHDLVSTIESVARDEMVCSPWMAMVLVRRVQALAAQRPKPLHRLTARETEILELVAEGLSNKEIAARLYIEVTTVKNHVHSILEKLGVTRRAEAVARMRMILAPSPGGQRERWSRDRPLQAEY
jgi:DNA-binding NarL/FixJ family response regulator